MVSYHVLDTRAGTLNMSCSKVLTVMRATMKFIGLTPLLALVLLVGCDSRVAPADESSYELKSIGGESVPVVWEESGCMFQTRSGKLALNFDEGTYSISLDRSITCQDEALDWASHFEGDYEMTATPIIRLTSVVDVDNGISHPEISGTVDGRRIVFQSSDALANGRSSTFER